MDVGPECRESLAWVAVGRAGRRPANKFARPHEKHAKQAPHADDSSRLAAARGSRRPVLLSPVPGLVRRRVNYRQWLIYRPDRFV